MAMQRNVASKNNNIFFHWEKNLESMKLSMIVLIKTNAVINKPNVRITSKIISTLKYQYNNAIFFFSKMEKKCTFVM